MSHAFGSPSIFLYLYVYLYFHLILFINLIFNPQLNLFLSRGLEILMSDEMPGCCMATRLQPITECLTNHLNAVSLWLYPTCYQLFTIALWKLMIKVCVMHQSFMMPRHLGTRGWTGLLLHLAGILMKFGPGLYQDLLEDCNTSLEEPGHWCGVFYPY